MFRAILFLVIAAEWTTAVSSAQTEIVTIDSGPIRGEEVLFEGQNYKAFKGIPYAAPPVGDLRFKAPQPPPKWTEMRDVIIYGKKCYQPRFSTRKQSSEDCLTLNVFTQSLERNNPKPVLVLIHGGAFRYGSGDDWLFGPEYLIQHNIVVVTINYRLGALGFLSTNTPDATGNWGMKDQVAALKWVQANIAEFGGDPKQVTIYGESAGGASVHLHLFSPLSKGLFQRAIVASGTVANSWVLKSPRQQERYSKNLARCLGASKDEYADPKRRIKFLRAADPIQMAKIRNEVLDEQDNTNPMVKPLPFTPVIEAPGTKGAFLTEDPVELLAAGKFTKVPLIMGLNDLEGGVLYINKFCENFTPEKRREIEKNVCQILPQPIKDTAIAKRACSEIAERMREVYFEGKGFDSSLLKFVYLWGDLIFSRDIYVSQRMQAKYSETENPLYNYYFTFDGKWNMLKRKHKVPLPGAIHMDDLSCLFLQEGFEKPVRLQSSPEDITRKRMISFITNFVKSGDPTPEVSDLVPVRWVPSNQEEFSTMVIGDELKLEKDFLESRMELWDWLSQTYGTGSRNPLRSMFKCFQGGIRCL